MLRGREKIGGDYINRIF